MALPSSADTYQEERTERRFRLLAEAIPQIVWTTRPDGYCDYTNRRWRDYSGMTAEESSGSGWMEAVHPEDRVRHGQLWTEFFHGNRGFEIEYRLRGADGVYRWFLARAEPICDDEGKVVRWFGTSTDIDDRRLAEDESLRRNGEMLRLAAEAARLGYWDWDIVSDTITWSETLENLSGTAPVQFGMNLEGFLGLVHPEDCARVGAAIRRAVDEGTPYEEELRLVNPDGTYRWGLTKGKVYYDKAGRPVRMSGIEVDISERKEAEVQARRAHERFLASVDNLLDCFAIYTSIRDDRGEIIDFRTEFVNLPCCHGISMSREEQIGRGLLELLPAHRESGLFEKYCRVVETGEPLDLEEVFYEDVFGGERIARIYTIRVAQLDDGYVAAWRDITDRKRTEAALRDNLELFRRVTEVCPAVLYVYDVVEGRSLLQNSAAEAQLGYSSGVIAGMGRDIVARLMHPDDQVRFHEHLDRVRVLKDGEMATFEYRMADAKGEWQWFFTHDSVFARGAGGEVTQIVGSSINITATRRVEEALRESEKRFRRFADSDIIGIIFGDVRGGISFANDEYLRIIGYTREEFESRRIGWADVTPPEWMPVDERAIAQARESHGSCPPYEKEYVRRDGTRIPVLVGFTLFGEEETVAFILDISERKGAEQEIGRLNQDLERRASLLDTLFRVLPVGIGVSEDPDCRHVRINPAFANMLRITVDQNASLSAPDEERPATFRVFQGGRELSPEELPMQRAAALGVESHDVELDVVYADGSSIKLLEYVAPLRDDRGQPRGAVGAFLDITSRTRAEAALREADRRKDEFLAMLAHELRNPLSALSNAFGLLRLPGATKRDVDWAMGVADRQLQNLVRLIDDLLDVSRVSTGKIRLKKEHVQASEIVARAAESVRPFMEARGHRFTVTVEDGPMPLQGDATRLEQILTNLLNNAAKYTDTGGRISLVARTEGDNVAIRVRDNGVGIAPEMLPRIFDLFSQVDESLERSHGGLGIGLSLVRTLTEMHDGSVSVESEGAGLGSEFAVHFPRSDLDRVESPSLAPPAEQLPDRPVARRVLVVDDNADTLQGMARVLGRIGHRVFTAHDGESALLAARDHAPEVIILDIGLPGMSGYEVAESIRREAGDVILIAVSGHAQEKDRRRSIDAGFDHHLAKPVNIDEVRGLLEDCRSRS